MHAPQDGGILRGPEGEFGNTLGLQVTFPHNRRPRSSGRVPSCPQRCGATSPGEGVGEPQMSPLESFISDTLEAHLPTQCKPCPET